MDTNHELILAVKYYAVTVQISSSINELIAKFNQRINLPIQSAIQEVETTLIDYYYAIIGSAATLSKYAPQQEQELGRSIEMLQLWKKPLPYLQSDPIIFPNPSSSKISLNLEHGLDKFYEGSAKYLITLLVSNFCTVLLDQISSTDKDVTERQTSLNKMDRTTLERMDYMADDNIIGFEFVKYE
jgi:hypothetical protein